MVIVCRQHELNLGTLVPCQLITIEAAMAMWVVFAQASALILRIIDSGLPHLRDLHYASVVGQIES